MNYAKLFGFGIGIWAVAYLIATAFVAYAGDVVLTGQIIVLVAVAVAAYVGGVSIKEHSISGVLKYSIGWVVIGLLLDAAITVPFTGWAVFTAWYLWVGYALIAFVPLLAIVREIRQGVPHHA